ncbi:hypothetical protein HOY80DRAFT_926470 [Tuber brumale]|nr:hypothetical protein HOY80DRAFT_926470 [Tuber brumale]
MSYSDEFPLPEGAGLYASDISGDGNCLFHAPSDQLYGYENSHLEIRDKVVEHTILITPLPFSLSLPSPSILITNESAIDVAFAQRLNRMARPGVYGDNMEIRDFAREYRCDVKIYHRDFAYVVTGREGGGGGGVEGTRKNVLHIAYHRWEHYSSVRNREKPHSGPPNVSPVTLTEAGRKENKRLANSSYVLQWMVEVVISSLPYLVDWQEMFVPNESTEKETN